MVFILAVEILFAGRYHVAEHNVAQNEGVQMQTEDAEIEYISDLGAPKGIVEPAEIVCEEVPMELTETEFTFGGIRVALPEKCLLNYQEREDGAVSVCLSAKENPSFLRRLYFTHYRAEWSHKWELALTAMELSGQEYANYFSIEGRADQKDRCFGFRIWDEEEGKRFYIFVCEEDLYLLEDHCLQDFRFETGYGEENLFWSDTDHCIAEETGCSVHRLSAKDGIFLLSEQREDGEESFVYQNGDFSEPLQILKGRTFVRGDINFDGHPDIEICDFQKRENSYFLWNAADKQFVEAVIPEDIVEGMTIEKKLDEFKTFWGDRSIWNDDLELQEKVEKLYRWDDTVLQEIRSISTRFEEKGVVIVLTDEENGECLRSETFVKKGWENNSEVRELFERFYEGYAPEELYYMRHDAPGEEQVIPDSLVKRLRSACERGMADELLESLKTGRELSDSERQEAGMKSADISRILEMEHVEMILVDLDNDGCDDIYVKEDFGGTGGYGEYVLCQGDGAGKYRETGLGTEEYVRNEFHVVRWEGKNYVCHRKGGRNGSGLILEGYRNGELVETVSFNRVQGKQTDSVIFCQDGYREMARKELEKASKVYDLTEKYIVSEGDAEQKEGNNNVFLCDIDNDGTVEKYVKRLIDYPIDFLVLEMEDEARELTAIPDCRDEAGREIMMWVDVCGGKNIMNVLYATGLYDYVAEGFLAEDTGGCSNLYAIERKTELEVEEVRTWELPGKRSRTP